MKTKAIFIVLSVLFNSVISCRKFVEVSPPITQLAATSVYESSATATAAVTGIYATMINNSVGGGVFGMSSLLGLAADELNLFPTPNPLLNETYTNSLTSTTGILFWYHLYNSIYQANIALEGVSSSDGIPALLKMQLIGEVKFIRAFCYFYLVCLYGDVPLILTTDYETNAVVSRTSSAEVFDQIVQDLKDAKAFLNEIYVSPDGSPASNRVRPNKGAASALLARVYLFRQNWELAEVEATSIINNSIYKLADDINTVFLGTGNKEAIWQLESVNNGFNTPDGNTFLGGYLGNGPRTSAPILLNDSLFNSFELGDLRKLNWCTSKIISGKTYYFPYKYKLVYTGEPPVEYPVLFRLAEQYLIRAEARAYQSKLPEALSDINVIRNRAGLANASATTQEEIIAAILRERRFELFTEYGHRWLDLSRTDNLNAVMSLVTPQKGGIWDVTDHLFPIPKSEIERNPNLIQNLGYY